jgi:hypothetical protein
MAGWYEVRVDGPNRHHYRLFCVLERDGMSLGLGGPSLVLITAKRSRSAPYSPLATTQKFGHLAQNTAQEILAAWRADSSCYRS